MASERLRLEGVSVELGGRRILEAVGLSIAAGERWALLGPNGGGKSTLLRAILGLVPLSAGAIAIGGVDRSRIDRRSLGRQLALLGQDESIDFELLAYEVALLGRSPHRRWFEGDRPDDHAAVARALELTDTLAVKDRVFPTLSGGERQRVRLAQSLAQAPELLLLDEPTNHLDLGHQLQILGQIKALGLTTLAALHDLNLALGFATHALVLAAGRVAAMGPVEAVLTPTLVSEVYGVAVERLTLASGRAVLAYEVPSGRTW